MFNPQRIRNRWLVAYTLIRNPSVQKFSASNISGRDTSDEEESCSQSGQFVDESDEGLIQLRGKLS